MANSFAADDTCKALWKFESGALTTDSKGGNNLTSHGTPDTDTSDFKEGSACVSLVKASSEGFDIADASLDAGFPLSYGDAARQGSFLCWFKPAGHTDNYTIWAIYDQPNNHSTVGLGRSASTKALYSSKVSIYPDIILEDDEWYHIAFVLDDTNHTAYLRVYRASTGEVFEYSGALGTLTYWSTTKFMIGYYSSANGTYASGRFDEFVVFNRLLLPDEIDQIRQQTYTGVDVPFELTPTGVYRPRSAAYSFTDDFEDGTTDAWDTANLVTIDSNGKLGDIYSAYLNSTTAYLEKALSGYFPEIWVEFDFLSKVSGTDSGYLLQFYNGSTIIACVYYSYNDSSPPWAGSGYEGLGWSDYIYLEFRRGHSGYPYPPAPNDFFLAPYSVKSHWKIRYVPARVNGIIQIWIDNVLRIDFTGDTGDWEPLITSICFGDGPGENDDAARFYLDNIQITNEAIPMPYLATVSGGVEVGGDNTILFEGRTIYVVGEGEPDGTQPTGGVIVSSDSVPVFVIPEATTETTPGGVEIGGMNFPKFVKPKIYKPLIGGGVQVGGNNRPVFYDPTGTTDTVIMTLLWRPYGGVAVGGLTSPAFVTPTTYRPTVTGGVKVTGPVISGVRFVQPSGVGSTVTTISTSGGVEVGGVTFPVFVSPNIYRVPIDPRIIAAIYVGGGGGACFVSPQIFVVPQPVGDILVGDSGDAIESTEVVDGWALGGKNCEPSMISGWKFNSFAVIRGQAYAAGEDGLYLLGGDDDDGQPIHPGVRIGPVNFGLDSPKRLRVVNIGQAGKQTRLRVEVKDGKTRVFYPRRDPRRITIDRDLQGEDFYFDISDFKVLSHFEVIPLVLFRK